MTAIGVDAQAKVTFLAVRTMRDDALAKAWDSLARYKFWQFGYHAARWVQANGLLPREQKQPNPFRELVHLAREKHGEPS